MLLLQSSGLTVSLALGIHRALVQDDHVPYVFAYNLLASYTSHLINANAIHIVLYGIAYERGPRKTSLYMFSKTQPLQTTYVGRASRNVACFLSRLALSIVEMWMQNSGHSISHDFLPLLHTLVIFIHAQDFLPRF